MSTRLTALLAAAALAAASAASAAEGAFAGVDQLLAVAEDLTREVESRSADSLRALDSCRDSFSVEGLRRSRSSSVLDPDASRAVTSWYACRAYAERKPKICAELKTWGSRVNFGGTPAISPFDRCEEQYFRTRFEQASLLGAPDAYDRCVEYDSAFPASESIFLDEDRAAACRLWTSNWHKSDTSIKLLPYVDRKIKSLSEPAALLDPGCAVQQWIVTRDLTDCAKETGHARARCEEDAALSKAAAAKDPELCGASVFCRLYLGAGPSACGVFSDQAREGVCSARARERLGPGGLEALRARQAELDGVLAAIGRLLPRAGASAEGDRRRQALERLKDRTRTSAGLHSPRAVSKG